MSLLELKGVGRKFGNRTALGAVSLGIERGEFVCLLGPSGSGKTTLLRIVAGLLDPKPGQVFFNGKDETKTPSRRRDIGFVFQNPSALFPHLNIFENVAFPFRRGNRKCEGNWREAVNKILHDVDLHEASNRPITNLSGGELQRIALARALVYRPALLLLDEPLSSLDNVLRAEMLTYMKNLHEKLGTTFLYVTHNEREARRVATHIAVLDDGRIHQFGPADDVFANPATDKVAQILRGI